MRVLLVEDDAMIAQAVSANLKDTGYAVDWVSRGSEVTAAVAAQAYDLLLLDLGLPGKDGLDVLAQIRSGGCTVPVLIVTARDDLHSRLNGLDSGADDYIVKPFDMAELQARMRAVLRRHGGQAQTLLSNGIISHSVGKMGGYSAQKNLRLALSYFDMPLTGQPEVFLGNSPTLFDDNGQLIESARGFVQGDIDQLVALIEKNPK